MRSPFYRFIFLITVMISFIVPPDSFAKVQEGYLESLFEEVEARENKADEKPTRLYRKLIEGALSLKLLDKYPKLRVGRIEFSSELSPDFKEREADIKKGQELILTSIATPDMRRDSLTFQELIDQIDRQFHDPHSKLQTMDWVFMASAFQTLKVSGSKAQLNALGVFFTEYILLNLINRLEQKVNPTKEENELLATLYYVVSQIYQNIMNDPKKYHFVQKKGEGKSAPLYLALPKTYDTEIYFQDHSVEPITSLTIDNYDIPYPEPYSYSILVYCSVTYDVLLGKRLDLLGTAVVVTPYYDRAWIPIIEYVAIDLSSPYYTERLSPLFWDSYFPYGILGIQTIYFDRLYHRWEKARKHDHRRMRGSKRHGNISNKLRNMRDPKWRKEQEKSQERKIQERLKQIVPDELRREHRLHEEGQEQRRLQEKQEKLGREEKSQKFRLHEEGQEQRSLQEKQKKLGREEKSQEYRLHQEEQEQHRLQKKQERLRHPDQKQEQRLLQEKQEKLGHEEKSQEYRLHQEEQEQHRLQEKQEKLGREEKSQEFRLRQEGQEQRRLQQEESRLRRGEERERGIIERIKPMEPQNRQRSYKPKEGFPSSQQPSGRGRGLKKS